MFYTLVALLLTVQAYMPITGIMNQEPAERYMQIACEYTGGECPETPLVYSTLLPRNIGGATTKAARSCGSLMRVALTPQTETSVMGF